MKAIRLTAAIMVSAAICAPAWAINKCTGPDGKVVYQDAPCQGKGEAISATPAAGAAQQQAAQGPQNWKLKAAQADERVRIRSAVLAGVPALGMTGIELEQALGLPDRINTGEYSSGSTQQRIYEQKGGTWYVYTDGLKVVAVQHSMTPGARQQSSGPCPSLVEIRSAETSASSITLSDAEKVERLKQIAEMRRCGR